MNEDFHPRILALKGKFTTGCAIVEALAGLYDVDVSESFDEAMGKLRKGTYHAILADVGDFLPLERGLVAQKAALVLDTIGEGVCIVDAEGTCPWSNKKMRSFSPQVIEKVRNICCQALMIFIRQVDCSPNLGQQRNRKFTLHAEGDQYLEVVTSPVVDEAGKVRHVVAVVWDATSGKRLQQKIDAIDASGRELARLEGDAIIKKSPAERLQLLQDKIFGYCRELLHFDQFAIRLLDKRTNKLELVISEGLTPEAKEIDLYAQPEGNGISGYVAATGRSYICHDTEKDPRYVLGIEHCKSSLTVPLRLHDKVVGIFNVESTQVGAFNEDDRQFAEIFGRYVALALHILDLMVVERCNTSGRFVDNVAQEIAQPLNDIVTEAQLLKEEYIGDDTMRGRLDRITDNVQTIRRSMQDMASGPNVVLGVQRGGAGKSDPLIQGKRVLIADDEPNIRNTIRDVLAGLGADCTTCKDGFEAINLIDQEPFDLVVSDIRMPNRTGYEIFAAARRRTDSLPVVLMTGFGYDPHHSIVRASQEGLSSVLFKPFKVDQMLEEIRKALKPGPSTGSPVQSPPPSS